MKRKPKVLVIGTGGAISAKPVKGKWKYGEFSQEQILDFIPGIREKYDIKTANVFRFDSSDIKPENWLTLANYIYYNMTRVDGIVVTMGTDTISYAAAAISFLIQNQSIPIVFTGSKVDPTQINTDARLNLRQAIAVAGDTDIAETLIIFNGKIIRATRSRNINASEFDSFRSFGKHQLGTIEHSIKIHGNYRKKSKTKPILQNKLEFEVAIMKVYPGFNGGRINNLINDGATGLVLQGFGLGNIPVTDPSIKEGIKYANKMNVPIVVTSDSELGTLWQEIYEAEIGTRLKGLKIIPVYDMLTETAYVKLMWVLSQTNDYNQVKKMMQHSYAGEITVLKKNGKKLV